MAASQIHPSAPPAYEDSTNSQYPGYYEQAPSGVQHISAEVDTMADHDEDSGAFAGSSFSDKAIRHAFIKKVYLILMVQLAVTTAIICLFIFCYPVRDWVQQNSWFYWISYGVFFVTYLTLVCVPALRRNFPANFICLAVFTLALSYVAATISSYYNTTIVLIAMGVTAVVCLAISIFAIQTKIDFTMCSGLLFALVMVLLMFGLACLITYLVAPNSFAIYVMSIVYGSLAALVFSLFLVFDTQMVVGGKHRKLSLSPEEYIMGALQLYLDIVNLFIILLGLIGGGSR